MALLVPKGLPDSRPLEVADEAVESWTVRGYVPAKGQSSKAPAKKAASKKSSK